METIKNQGSYIGEIKQSRLLIPVAIVSTGGMEVTTSCDILSTTRVPSEGCESPSKHIKTCNINQMFKIFRDQLIHILQKVRKQAQKCCS